MPRILQTDAEEKISTIPVECHEDTRTGPKVLSQAKIVESDICRAQTDTQTDAQPISRIQAAALELPKCTLCATCVLKSGDFREGAAKVYF